jgi:hypothetical protein
MVLQAYPRNRLITSLAAVVRGYRIAAAPTIKKSLTVEKESEN